jgi:hypothetical protein
MQPRVPSRQLLQTALDLAQKAVEMDKNNDVAGALAAYRDAVSKLRVVMERVGVDPTSDGKRGGKNEEEGRTLRGIVSVRRLSLTAARRVHGAYHVVVRIREPTRRRRRGSRVGTHQPHARLEPEQRLDDSSPPLGAPQHEYGRLAEQQQRCGAEHAATVASIVVDQWTETEE